MAEERLERLTGLVEELAQRLADLERRGAAAERAEGVARSLSRRVAEELRAGRRVPPTGEVLWAGSYWPSGELSFGWEERRSVEDLLAVADDRLARVLAAFASPARLALVKALLGGERSTGELMAGLGLRTTGQLYHHLNNLIAAGVVVQRARNRYGLNPARLRLVLAVLAVGPEIAAGQGAAAGTMSPG